MLLRCAAPPSPRSRQGRPLWACAARSLQLPKFVRAVRRPPCLLVVTSREAAHPSACCRRPAAALCCHSAACGLPGRPSHLRHLLLQLGGLGPGLLGNLLASREHGGAHGRRGGDAAGRGALCVGTGCWNAAKRSAPSPGCSSEAAAMPMRCVTAGNCSGCTRAICAAKNGWRAGNRPTLFTARPMRLKRSARRGAPAVAHLARFLSRERGRGRFGRPPSSRATVALGTKGRGGASFALGAGRGAVHCIYSACS